MQNAYMESYNGKFQDECPNESCFESVVQAREAIAIWNRDYNEVRPLRNVNGSHRPRCSLSSHPTTSTADAGSVS
ncbi:integrase core domain-containing protein [Delftia sp. GW456-R20]|uniref:integrase core domain-containing protein n=1 Tax=Delftia sp. GW456-R20 TaxID=1827145 RepID=UPI003FA42B05